MSDRSTSLSEPIHRIDTNGFILTERIHPPNWILPQHAHEGTIMGCILEGSFIEAADRRAYECEPFSLQILPGGERHAYQFGRTRVRCLTIEVDPQTLVKVRLYSDILERTNHLTGLLLSAHLRQLYREFRVGDRSSALTVEGLLFETLGVASRQAQGRQSAQPLWLQRAREMVHSQFTDNLSLADLAACVEVHPSHLAKMFRKHYGCSVGEYVRQLRLDYAAKEIADTDKSLAEIALAAGFYDQSHLARAFTLHLKTPPAEYRAAAREKRR
jgi:AraC family transcriptional regulator